jgi:hypothetical protein
MIAVGLVAAGAAVPAGLAAVLGFAAGAACVVELVCVQAAAESSIIISIKIANVLRMNAP